MAESWRSSGVLTEGGGSSAVGIEFAGRHLGVFEEGRPPRWWDADKVSDRGNGRFLLEGGSLLEIQDPSLAIRLKQTPRAVAPRLWPKFTTLFAAIVLACWAAFSYGLPLLAEGAAGMVPVELEKKLGDAVADSISPPAAAANDENALAVLAEMTGRLERGFDRKPPYRFEVRLHCTREMNALAAPGGVIVVFDGLLAEIETHDQLAAVLAHEMQHVVLRHGLRAIFRRSALQIGFGLLAGDLTSVAALAAAGLTDLGYSREHELEADREGVRLMARAGFKPREMLSLFEMFARKEGGDGRGLAYLRTHPFATERRAAVEAVLADLKQPAPAGVNGTEFRLLQRACPGDTPAPRH